MNDKKRICANCGQSLEADDAFCGECGHRVSLESNQVPQLKPAEKPQQAGVPRHVPPPRLVSPPQASNEKSRQECKKLWLTGVILVGLLIAAAVVFFINEPVETAIVQQDSGQANWAISQIKITTVDSFYEQNASAGKILVVTGKVINQSPSPLRFIRLEAAVYGYNDAFLSRQFSYAGNILERERLQSMAIDSIKRLMYTPYGHNANEVLVSGGLLPFMIVFAGLPETGISRYDIRVDSADPD